MRYAPCFVCCDQTGFRLTRTGGRMGTCRIARMLSGRASCLSSSMAPPPKPRSTTRARRVFCSPSIAYALVPVIDTRSALRCTAYTRCAEGAEGVAAGWLEEISAAPAEAAAAIEDSGFSGPRRNSIEMGFAADSLRSVGGAGDAAGSAGAAGVVVAAGARAGDGAAADLAPPL